MIQHIVVPLDGSNPSESVLPTAQELALRCSALVTLIRVVKGTKGYEQVTDYTKPPAQQASARPAGGKEKKAEDYLSVIAKKMQDQGIKVQTKVLLGKPGQAIAFYAEHNPCDLITMASHGRSGLLRWVRGSVADRVFRYTSKPILKVRAPR